MKQLLQPWRSSTQAGHPHLKPAFMHKHSLERGCPAPGQPSKRPGHLCPFGNQNRPSAASSCAYVRCEMHYCEYY